MEHDSQSLLRKSSVTVLLSNEPEKHHRVSSKPPKVMQTLRAPLGFCPVFFPSRTKSVSRYSLLQICCSKSTPISRANRTTAAMSDSTPSPAPATSTTESDVVSGLSSVLERISQVSKSSSRENDVQLVAVSKTKPLNLLQAAYSTGQRHFGENYVQELVTKHSELPSDIKWHYIGPLQSNKAKLLLSVPNLHVVETVDREKTAAALNKACVSVGRENPLNVMVQVNTSGEESKSGSKPGDETIQLAKAVHELSNLKLVGLMTIGAPDDSEEPAAFKILTEERETVAKALSCSISDLKLSMGMSGDFEVAIRMGSDSVRVGSTIFGARDYSRK